MDHHQASLQPNLLLFNSRLCFNPTPTFLGVTFDRTLSVSKHASSMKAKFFSRTKTLNYIFASSWGPSKESLSLLCKAFLRPLLIYGSPGWFPFISATNLTKLERFHRAASRATSGRLSSSPIPLHLFEASLPSIQVTLTHFALSFYERALRLPTSFLFQVWPDLKCNQDSADPPGELLPPLTLCFLLERLSLLALSLLFGICLPSRWSPLFLSHAPAPILFSLTKVRLSLTLTLSLITIR